MNIIECKYKFTTPKSVKVTLTYTARRMFGLWWSRHAVTRTARAMFGAWEALARDIEDSEE